MGTDGWTPNAQLNSNGPNTDQYPTVGVQDSGQKGFMTSSYMTSNGQQWGRQSDLQQQQPPTAPQLNVGLQPGNEVLSDSSNQQSTEQKDIGLITGWNSHLYGNQFESNNNEGTNYNGNINNEGLQYGPTAVTYQQHGYVSNMINGNQIGSENRQSGSQGMPQWVVGWNSGVKSQGQNGRTDVQDQNKYTKINAQSNAQATANSGNQLKTLLETGRKSSRTSVAQSSSQTQQQFSTQIQPGISPPIEDSKVNSPVPIGRGLPPIRGGYVVSRFQLNNPCLVLNVRYFPHPGNPRKFYECIDGGLSESQCPGNGQIWSQVSRPRMHK